MTTPTRKWALVTGATGGLGHEFCLKLAERGYNIVATARGEEALAALSSEIRRAHEVEVLTIALDLAERDACHRLKAAVAERQIMVETLINNAGYGLHGRFTAGSHEDEIGMVDVNVRALTDLTHLFVGDMAKNGGGHVLLVASAAAFQPIPGYAVYAASKAYVLSFGHALRQELHRKTVSVSVLCPGPVLTPFWSRADHNLNRFASMAMMSADDVAENGLRGLFKGRAEITPGLSNQLAGVLARLFPRSILAKGAAVFMRNSK